MQINLSEIKGITTDSRCVKPGFVFVAIKGLEQNGHDYINQAIERGANIIILQDEIEKIPSVNYIHSNNTRKTLSKLSALIYPKQPKYIFGVTGTSGKSSVVHFVRELLFLLEKTAVSVGTLGVIGSVNFNSNLTTPPTIELHQILNEIADNVEYLAIECSSHGISQHRLDSVNFTACAFTNFTQDHLDYHIDMKEYFRAKTRLFSIMQKGTAVLNTDIEQFDKLYELCLSKGHKVISYGKKTIDLNHIKIDLLKNNGLYQEVEWSINGELYYNKIKLIGEFQIYNLACAIGLLLSSGIEARKIMPLVGKLTAVTGRMELVADYNDAAIFVDYAHKPDALLHSLKTLKNSTKNKLWLVFGCGGERDKDKRSKMGKIAQQYADYVIITDDNPRNENPELIRKDILAFCAKAIEIDNRVKAIKYALDHVKPGDCLMIAGKGHENYQIIGKTKHYFSDQEEVIKYIKKNK